MPTLTKEQTQRGTEMENLTKLGDNLKPEFLKTDAKFVILSRDPESTNPEERKWKESTEVVKIDEVHPFVGIEVLQAPRNAGGIEIMLVLADRVHGYLPFIHERLVIKSIEIAGEKAYDSGVSKERLPELNNAKDVRKLIEKEFGPVVANDLVNVKKLQRLQ